MGPRSNRGLFKANRFMRVEDATMSEPIPTAASPLELQSFVDSQQTGHLKEALSLLHSWGIRKPDYLPVLEGLLSSEDQDVLRLSLGIMLNFERGPRKQFLRLKNQLPVLEKLITTKSS